MEVLESLNREALRNGLVLSIRQKNFPTVRVSARPWGCVEHPSAVGIFLLEDAMSKKVLDFETDVKVGPALLELRALGNALVCVGLAGETASLWAGTLTNLGLMVAEKAAEVGEALGVMQA